MHILRFDFAGLHFKANGTGTILSTIYDSEDF